MSYRIYEHFDGTDIFYTVKKKNWLIWKYSDSSLLSNRDYSGLFYPITFETYELALKAIYLTIDAEYAKQQKPNYTKVVDEIDCNKDYPMI